jgi:hypothetical protein
MHAPVERVVSQVGTASVRGGQAVHVPVVGVLGGSGSAQEAFQVVPCVRVRALRIVVLAAETVRSGQGLAAKVERLRGEEPKVPLSKPSLKLVGKKPPLTFRSVSSVTV